MKKLALYKCFNPVAPTRGATGNNGANGLPAQLFQSTHPHGVRPRTFAPCRCLDCFNPRTHTGCDNAWSKALPLRRVSIHAPTRGATLVSERKFFTVAFQSTHPHGVRPGRHLADRYLWGVSIHAPTRGATFIRLNLLERHTVSIHAPTRGATCI